MSKVIDLKGQRFGILTVLERAENKNKNAQWKCQCDCGNICVKQGYLLRKGAIKSCGCMKSDFFKNHNPNKTHGESHSRLYIIWSDMLRRCEYELNDNYNRYGKRGVTVCDEWHDYLTFKEWAVSHGYSDNLSIDRIDGTKGYMPSNCRWITEKQQANNRKTCVYLECRGKRMTMTQWSEYLNVPMNRIKTRLKLGWSVEDALFKPKMKSRYDRM